MCMGVWKTGNSASDGDWGGGEATATMESYEVSLEIRTDEDLLQ